MKFFFLSFHREKCNEISFNSIYRSVDRTFIILLVAALKERFSFRLAKEQQESIKRDKQNVVGEKRKKKQTHQKKESKLAITTRRITYLQRKFVNNLPRRN